jgi:uncharacterized phage-associated protein
MAYPVNAIANRLLSLAKAEGKTIDPLKLQKLTYLAHGWHMAFYMEPLVQEGFEAWRYGPVCQPLYREFKKFGGNPITEQAPAPQVTLAPDAEHILREVWRVYGCRTGLDLSSLTHEPGSAWRATYDGSLWSNPSIPNDLIQMEFDRRRANS